MPAVLRLGSAEFIVCSLWLFYQGANDHRMFTACRRYFFKFKNVQELAVGLYLMTDNVKISTSEFFDTGGRFHPEKYTKRANVMNTGEKNMDMSDDEF